MGLALTHLLCSIFSYSVGDLAINQYLPNFWIERMLLGLRASVGELLVHIKCTNSLRREGLRFIPPLLAVTPVMLLGFIQVLPSGNEVVVLI